MFIGLSKYRGAVFSLVSIKKNRLHLSVMLQYLCFSFNGYYVRK